MTEPLPESPRRWLASQTTLVEASPGSAPFRDAAPAAQGLVVRTYTHVDGALLDSLPALRVVGRAGVGLDNIDLEACRARGIRVVHTPEANTQAVVEYVLCLLCDALRPRLEVTTALAPEAWKALRDGVAAPRQMNELRLGILGLGRIGSRVAQVARAIGFTVAYADLREILSEARAGAKCISVEELFTESDVITLHIDGRPSNRHFVNRALLERMVPHALLVNTSRGMVLDTAALAALLRARPETRAVLDVHEPEPFGEEYPLLGLSNARLLPHMAARTKSATEAMAWVVRDVVAVLQGQQPHWAAV